MEYVITDSSFWHRRYFHVAMHIARVKRDRRAMAIGASLIRSVCFFNVTADTPQLRCLPIRYRRLLNQSLLMKGEGWCADAILTVTPILSTISSFTTSDWFSLGKVFMKSIHMPGGMSTSYCEGDHLLVTARCLYTKS